jgi:hypothetical protein
MASIPSFVDVSPRTTADVLQYRLLNPEVLDNIAQWRR